MDKKYQVEFDRFSKEWKVSTTRNGWQWTTVFTGTKEEAAIISRAYSKVGFKKSKND